MSNKKKTTTGGESMCSRRVSSSCILQDIYRVTHVIKSCWTPLYVNKYK